MESSVGVRERFVCAFVMLQTQPVQTYTFFHFGLITMSVFLSRTNIAMLRMVVVTPDAVCTETENSWFGGSLSISLTHSHISFSSHRHVVMRTC